MSVSVFWTAVRRKGKQLEQIAGPFSRVTMQAGELEELYERYGGEDTEEDDWVDMGWRESCWSLDPRWSPSWRDCLDANVLGDSLRSLRRRLMRTAGQPSIRLVIRVKDPKSRGIVSVVNFSAYLAGSDQVFVQGRERALVVRDPAGSELRREVLKAGQVLKGSKWGAPSTPFLADVAEETSYGEPLDTINHVIETCRLARRHKGRVLFAAG
jgi:hypothetical protein